MLGDRYVALHGLKASGIVTLHVSFMNYKLMALIFVGGLYMFLYFGMGMGMFYSVELERRV